MPRRSAVVLGLFLALLALLVVGLAAWRKSRAGGARPEVGAEHVETGDRGGIAEGVERVERAELAPVAELSASPPGRVGPRRLDLRILDAATEDPIGAYTARLRAPDKYGRPSEFDLTLPGPPPGDERFERIAGSDFTLVVVAAGYAPAEVDVGALEPGEERTVDVRLGPASGIDGTLRQADGSPATGTITLLPHVPLPPEPADASGRPAFYQAVARRDEALRGRERFAVTDETGRFSFADLAPGSYDLLGAASALLEVVSVGVPVSAGRTTEVELRLPPGCFLSGRVLAPGGADFSGLSLGLRPKPRVEQPRRIPRSAWDASSAQGELEVDGAFLLGPVPPGEYDVCLFPTGPEGYEACPWPVRLDSLALLGGTTARDIDARERFPGALHVRLLHPEEVAGGASVETVPGSSESCWTSIVGGDLDERGELLLERLPAGRYLVVLRDPRLRWVHVVPTPVVVGPVSRTDVEVDLVLHRGTLTLLEESGAPLADCEFVLHPSAPEGFMVVPGVAARSDGAGRLDLRLGAGTYSIERAPFRWYLSQDDARVFDASTFTWGSEGSVSEHVVFRELFPYNRETEQEAAYHPWKSEE